MPVGSVPAGGRQLECKRRLFPVSEVPGDLSEEKCEEQHPELPWQRDLVYRAACSCPGCGIDPGRNLKQLDETQNPLYRSVKRAVQGIFLPVSRDAFQNCTRFLAPIVSNSEKAYQPQKTPDITARGFLYLWFRGLSKFAYLMISSQVTSLPAPLFAM